MLRINNLTVDHGAIRAIHGISFSVEKGQLAAVIGSNGAGKTTLMRTLSGLKSFFLGVAVFAIMGACVAWWFYARSAAEKRS